MDVINKLAATVGPGHTVDLNDPELTIVAEVCQVKCDFKNARNLLKLILFCGGD